jgi:predicted nucleotide-binding protein
LPTCDASSVRLGILEIVGICHSEDEGGNEQMARAKGSKNRNYPPVTLSEALRVARTIQDEASGIEVSRLTLAELLGISPGSSAFRDLVAASRFYGLTDGGINADEFSLTRIGTDATGADEVAQVAALKSAVMNVPPYKVFFDAFSNKKVPSSSVAKEYLTKHAEVAPDRVNEAVKFILEDGRTAGLVREISGSGYIDLAGTPAARVNDVDVLDGLENPLREPESADAPLEADELQSGAEEAELGDAPPGPPKKVFIAHGKNRAPLEQLKKALDQFKVRHAVAVDEPMKGRPISRKVAELMQNECSSGIFIFTADERFLKEGKNGEMEEVWRPSENVVYELGAASIIYENRIVIFKEKGVTFPSDFSDLGYIEFEKDQLATEIGSLFSELVALDILEVRAKG